MTRSFFLLCLMSFLASIENGVAQQQHRSDSRRILHLYDSVDREYIKSETHEYTQVIFDHLGLILVPHNIRSGLPPHEELSEYRGIFTWFTDWQLPDPNAYLEWLREESLLGRYIVVWGQLGAYSNDKGERVSEKSLNTLYRLWGFENHGMVIGSSYMLEKPVISETMFGFERKVTVGISDFVHCRPLDDANVDIYLSVRERGQKSPPIPVAVRHPYGGFILQSFIYYTDPRTYQCQWQVNPFAYLREAFRLEDMPAVDLTTLNGCRTFYAHIDGDGSLNLNSTDPRKIAAEIIHEEILSKYPLPTTVGTVEGEVIISSEVQWVRDRERVVNLMRQIYQLENVEGGSHGCTHPMHWQKGVTAIPLDGLSRRAENAAELKFMEDAHYPNTALFTMDEKEWLEREILGSIDFINKELLPEGKRCEIFQWTGDCTPSQLGLKTVQDNGLLNINRGDGRFDSLFPSYTSLAPAYLLVGDYVQYYTSMPNEIIYTDTWIRNFSGLRHVIETFKNTGYPRRIKPMNIYYHFYSGERPASLGALKELHEYCLEQEIAPLFTTEYVKIVRNSLKIEFNYRDDGWHWTNARESRTLRWDGRPGYPDLTRSKGVIGYQYDDLLKCLYLHLDGSGSGHVAFREDGMNPLHVTRATGYINNWRWENESVFFTYAGHGKAWIELSGALPDQRYSIRLGENVRTQESTAVGELRLELPDSPFTKNLQIEIIPDPIP